MKQIILLKKRTLIVLTVLFAVSLALQLFVSLYQAPRADKMQVEWMKLREFEGRGSALHDRETLYRNGVAGLAKFREKIYPKSQFARFIGELYELASKSSLELASITYKPTLDKENRLLSYAMTLTVSGRYTQLKRFIYDLGAGNGNILVIDSISMSASGASSETVQLQLLITTLFKMEPK
jgi:hypothetical protein